MWIAVKEREGRRGNWKWITVGGRQCTSEEGGNWKGYNNKCQREAGRGREAGGLTGKEMAARAT